MPNWWDYFTQPFRGGGQWGAGGGGVSGAGGVASMPEMWTDPFMQAYRTPTSAMTGASGVMDNPYFGGGFNQLPMITKPWTKRPFPLGAGVDPYVSDVYQPLRGVTPQAQQPQAPQYSPAPTGVDAAWWEAFQGQHEGVDPITYYGGGRWQTPQAALGEAMSDRAWGEKWAEHTGKPPTEQQWQQHWMETRGGRSFSGTAGPGAAAQKESTWWGQPLFGTGEVDFPGYGKINLSQVTNYSQLPQPLRSWYARVVESARSLWPSPMVPPVTGFTPVASEL